MNKMRVISCVLAAALIAASFAGCGESKTAASDNASSKQEQSQKQESKGNIAKVVSLEGNKMTVVLADMPERDGSAPSDQNGSTPSGVTQSNGKGPQDGAQPPDNGSKPEGGQPGGGQQQGTPPDGESSATPDNASGAAVNGQQGQGGPEIKFSSDEVTYTLSNDVTITKGRGDQSEKIDLSEITEGSVIRFTTAEDSGSEVITSITVMD